MNHGGSGLPDPGGADLVTAPESPAGPRVEMRPEGWRLVDRRGLLKAAGMAAAAVPSAALLAACGGGSSGSGSRAVRIGMVSPQTGALRNYADVDNHVVERMRNQFKDGIRVGRNTLPVEIFVRDGQSDRNRAASAAADLIFTDRVDVVLVGGTADNVNPVSDICEAQGVPCISSAVPWEAWFYARGGDPQRPFVWTYHLNWGMADLRAAYRGMWGPLEVPRSVALLLPRDQEGDAFANPDYGLPKLGEEGFQIVGRPEDYRYNVDARSYSSIVRNIVENEVSIVAGVPNVTDFSAFWRELNEQNYRPHIVCLSRALLFRDDLQAFGVAAKGFSTEVGWSPRHQFRSYLTQRTAEEIAAEYNDDKGRPWPPILGFTHAMFEVLAQALVTVESIDEPQGIADAISRLQQARTVVGPVTFGDQAKQLPKNVASVPLAGGVWTQQNNEFGLHVVSATTPGLNVIVEPDQRMIDLQAEEVN
ncbi:ABC transporter substrate-binding protein [Parafrankia sp. FMc2]|uniref:ABC transporter substrate-binding protein n=1 Tax=Parafrankia sp. FMc2 TaxID=3233196 RepID=UPI0034D457AD